MAYELPDGSVQLEFDWHCDEDDPAGTCFATAPGSSILYYEIAPREACLRRPVDPPPRPPHEEWDGDPGEYWYVWIMNLDTGQGEYLPMPYPSAEDAMCTVERVWECSQLSSNEKAALAQLVEVRVLELLPNAHAVKL